MAKFVGCLICLGALAACDSSTGMNGSNNVNGNNTVGPEVCTYVGDPDTGGIVKVCGPVWDCEALPNGDKKCSGKFGTPDGAGGWSCRHDGEHLVCDIHTPAAVGGAGWDCQGDTCTGGSSSADAPPGGGAWVCVTDQELGTTTCTSQSGGDVPPGGSSWDCLIDKEFLTCEQSGGGSGTPDGGSGSDGGSGTADSGSTGSNQLTPGGGMAGGGYPCWCPSAANGDIGLPPNVPLAKITSKLTTVNGRQALRARVTYSKQFCDNTYGTGSIGWSPKRGHTFKDLVGSDHQVLYFHDCNGRNVTTVKLDYITADASASSGYSCLGVSGGDGDMIQGNPDHVVGWTSSLAENLNTLGYLLLTDSPATDASYTPNAQYPDWMFDMWYQVDIDLAAFGTAGPCRVTLLSLHASPAKTSSDTIDVEPCPCQ